MIYVLFYNELLETQISFLWSSEDMIAFVNLIGVGHNSRTENNVATLTIRT